jgi:uncharacterized membrane protein
MFLMGRTYQKQPFEGHSYAFGFRTRYSAKSRQTWEFAQKYGGKIWWISGLVMTPLTAVVMVLMIRHGVVNIEMFTVIVVAVQCVVMFLSHFFTNRAIKRRFDENGERK